MISKREYWLDCIKVVACILVVLGHFFQSMTKSNIVDASYLYKWFNQTIYMFHVPLFFICSGYLYQQFSCVNSLRSWKNNVIKKIVSLGIPYFIFSILTWLLKTIFSRTVNSGMEYGLLSTLFFNPTAPYWYLYCLFLIFIITPTVPNTKSGWWILGISIIFKVISIVWECPIYAMAVLFTNEIWFVLGMLLCKINIKKNFKRYALAIGVAIGITFFAVSIIFYDAIATYSIIYFLVGLMACLAVILVIGYAYCENRPGKVFSFMAKYTLPIFLMHTLFAAPVRIALLKIGVYNAFIHIILGLIFSFLGPIVAAEIMSKVKWLDFILYPSKYIKLKKK